MCVVFHFFFFCANNKQLMRIALQMFYKWWHINAFQMLQRVFITTIICVNISPVSCWPEEWGHLLGTQDNFRSRLVTWKIKHNFLLNYTGDVLCWHLLKIWQIHIFCVLEWKTWHVAVTHIVNAESCNHKSLRTMHITT